MPGYPPRRQRRCQDRSGQPLVDGDLGITAPRRLVAPRTRAGKPGSPVIRAVVFPDLLIAAVAGRERVSVLHYDIDFDLIAGVTGQPV
jgi:predicted nucleic acid-binding protein